MLGGGEAHALHTGPGMRRVSPLAPLLAMIATAAMLASPRSAAADPENPPRLSSGPVRPYVAFGYGVDATHVDGGAWMALAPIAPEIGLRVERRLEVGLELAYADTMSWTCDACAGASRWRLGANVRFHPWPDWVVDPWFGSGVGLERVSMPYGINATGQASFFGVDLPRLQTGFDLHLVGGLVVGPYVSAELSWLEPNAPAWATVDAWPLHLDMGVRMAATL